MSEAKRNEPYLSVAISAYNEEARIGPSLRKIVTYLDQAGYPYEIVVNDDGSRDRTKEVVQSIGCPHIELLSAPINEGKGAGIRRAVLASKGTYILFTDADLSTPIEEVSRLLAKLNEGSDIAIGSRIHPDGSDMRSSQPSYRRLLGKVFHELVALWAVRGIGDTQSGFKCFRREVGHELFAATVLNSIIFDVEILFVARKRGFSIAEVPVVWTSAGGSRMRVTLRHAMRVVWDLARVPLVHRGNPSDRVKKSWKVVDLD